MKSNTVAGLAGLVCFGLVALVIALEIAIHEPAVPPAKAEIIMLPAPAVGEVISEAYAEQVWKSDDVGFHCRAMLKRRADHGLRGASTVLGMRIDALSLDRFSARMGPHARMWFAGDDIELQDAFDRWLIGNWRCEWDINAKRVTDVSLGYGRMVRR